MERIRRAGVASAVASALVIILLPTGVLAALSVARSNRSDDIRETDRAVTNDGAALELGPKAVVAPPAPVTTRPTVTVTTTSRPPGRTSPDTPTTTTVAPGDAGVVTTSPDPFDSDAYDPATTVKLPYAAGRSSWSGTRQGVTLSVRMEPTAPRTGEAVTFFVDATSLDEPCCRLAFVYGDGYGDQTENGSECPNGGPQAPGTRHWQFVHVYNRPGPQQFLFSAMTGNCLVSGRSIGMLAWFDLAEGAPPTSQGPALPTVTADSSVPVPGHEDDRSYVTVAGMAHDPDGYVPRMVVSWGDGSPSEIFQNPNGCTTGPSGWPVSFGTRMWLPATPPSHHYSEVGTYQVSVTAYSTGCGGGDPQEATDSFLWAATSP